MTTDFSKIVAEVEAIAATDVTPDDATLPPLSAHDKLFGRLVHEHLEAIADFNHGVREQGRLGHEARHAVISTLTSLMCFVAPELLVTASDDMLRLLIVDFAFQFKTPTEFFAGGWTPRSAESRTKILDAKPKLVEAAKTYFAPGQLDDAINSIILTRVYSTLKSGLNAWERAKGYPVNPNEPVGLFQQRYGTFNTDTESMTKLIRLFERSFIESAIATTNDNKEAMEAHMTVQRCILEEVTELADPKMRSKVYKTLISRVRTDTTDDLRLTVPQKVEKLLKV